MSKDHKIAVLAYRQSGKTVFLTSLIWHLLAYDHDDKDKTYFDLGDRYIKFLHKDEDQKEPTFPFKKYRADFDNKKDWPNPTYTASRYRVRMLTERSRFSPIKKTLKILNRNEKKRNIVTFYDVPGERMADILIYQCSDFEDWCKAIRTQFDAWGASIDTILAVSDDSSTPMNLAEYFLSKYRAFLANAYMNDSFPITPSSILFVEGNNKEVLGVQQHIKNHTVGWDTLEHDEKREELRNYLTNDGIIGTDKNHQFCPLPKFIFEGCKDNNQFSDLIKEFKKNYTLYRKSVVAPIFEYFRDADSIAVLLDIPHIIERGINEKDKQKHFIESIRECLNYTFTKNLIHGKKRIAYIATKADRFLKSQRRFLIDLVKEIVNESYQESEEHLKWIEDCFYCSSCVQTVPFRDKQTDEERLLVPSEPISLELINSTDKKNGSVFEEKAIPSKWSDSVWRNKSPKALYSEYHNYFKKLRLNIQTSDSEPLCHINLDKIFRFLISQSK